MKCMQPFVPGLDPTQPNICSMNADCFLPLMHCRLLALFCIPGIPGIRAWIETGGRGYRENQTKNSPVVGLSTRKCMLSKYACYGLLNSSQITVNGWAQTKINYAGEVVCGCMLCNNSKIKLNSCV